MGTLVGVRAPVLGVPGGVGGARLGTSLLAFLAFFLLAGPTLAQGAVCPARPGALPTYGGARPGPAAVVPPSLDLGYSVGAVESPAVEVPAVPAVGGPIYPVALSIPYAGVNAGIELLGEVGGVMQNPTGPWVVAWYAYLGSPGVPGNTVMAGHVDYAGVGPAVFAGVGGLPAGAEIAVVGGDGQVLVYAVEWVASYDVASLTPADLAPIIGSTAVESLTLITCGGAFDPATAEYLSRTVVRATRVGSYVPAPAPEPVDEGAWRFQPGATAEVAAADIDLRSRPSSEAGTVGHLAEGAPLAITGESIAADGYRWWPVQDATGKQGYVAGPHLVCGKGTIPWTQPSGRPRFGDGSGGPGNGPPRDDGTAGPSHGGPANDGTAGPAPVPITADRPDPPD